MSIKNKVGTVTRSAAMLWVLGTVGMVPLATVCAPAVADAYTVGATCEYSLQLQNSDTARNQYIAQVIELTGVDLTASSVDTMYSNVQTVSYTSTTTSTSGTSTDFWGLGLSTTTTKTSLDSLSMNCLGCHDGLAASSIHADIRNDPFRSGSSVSSFRSDHPVGMYYSSYVAASSEYKPVAPGTTRMLFVNGQVGCLTCHDPLNPAVGHLVKSDRQSALCLTCHNK